MDYSGEVSLSGRELDELKVYKRPPPHCSKVLLTTTTFLVLLLLIERLKSSNTTINQRFISIHYLVVYHPIVGPLPPNNETTRKHRVYFIPRLKKYLTKISCNRKKKLDTTS